MHVEEKSTFVLHLMVANVISFCCCLAMSVSVREMLSFEMLIGLLRELCGRLRAGCVEVVNHSRQATLWLSLGTNGVDNVPPVPVGELRSRHHCEEPVQSVTNAVCSDYG